MKKIIFQDGEHTREIELRDTADVDELWYRTYRFQRSKGWFDFDWKNVNAVEDARLHELVPDLKHFRYMGKMYVNELSWHCHEYDMELGANNITMADKIIQKFYKTVMQDEFETESVELGDLLESIDCKKTDLHNAEKELSCIDQFTDAARHTESQLKVRTLQTELGALLKDKADMRNPAWVPGVSMGDSYQARIKFALFKRGHERSSCNLTMDQCKTGIPDKVKKQLLKEIEKDPTFTYTFKMYLVFDYLDSLPEASKCI